MRAFDLAFDVLAEVGSLASEAQQILVLGMVQHLYGIALEDVFKLVVLQHVVGLPSLLVHQPKAIHRVNLNTLGDIHPFLHDILAHFLTLVVRFQVVEVGEFVLFVVGEAEHFVVGEIVGQAEAVQQHEVDILRGLVHVFKGVVYQRADGCV